MKNYCNNEDDLEEEINAEAVKYNNTVQTKKTLKSSAKKDSQAAGTFRDPMDSEDEDKSSPLADDLSSEKSEQKPKSKFLKIWDKVPTHGRSDQVNEFLEQCFDNLLNNFEFLSVVMYPDYKNRRNFVHEAWLIAKFTENFELKMAISKDPYFFLTRLDILQLIRTSDDDMIEHMLKIQVAL